MYGSSYEVTFESNDVGEITIYFHKTDEGKFEVFDFDIRITHPEWKPEHWDYLNECLYLNDDLKEKDEEEHFEYDVLYRRRYKLGHRSDKSYIHYYGTWEFDCVTWLDEEDKDFSDQTPLEEDIEGTKEFGSWLPKWPEHW